MDNRYLASTACALMLGLSACGGGGGGGGGGGIGSAPPPPMVTPTPTPTPAPPPPPPPPPPTNFVTTEYERSNAAVSSGAISAWQKGATGQGVKLAVIDSGINPALAEFAGRIDPDSHDVAGTRALGDEDGHGTAVTAVAAGARNDAHNMGIAFNATIISYRADQPGSCTANEEKGCQFSDSAIAHGIDDARIAGAKVINMSLGGSPPNSVLLSSMQRAVNAGIILVISAGNDGEDATKGANADAFALIPAQNFPGQVIIAGSVGVNDGAGGTNLDQLSPFSNKAGTGAAHYLTALGYRVRTIDHTGAGFLYSGTSFSAPVISGAVALMAQAFPNLTAPQIVDILFTTADDLGAAGTDTTFGRGRLNITRAFQPIGTTSLAGTEVKVTDASATGGVPEAAGDGGTKDGLGAIILDGYDRAFAIDLAKGLRQAEARRPLERSLTGNVRGSSVTAGPVSIAMSVAQRPGQPGLFDVARFGIGPEDARRSRLVAGSAIARLDSKTKAAFGFSQGAKSIERQLTGAEGGAFLIARDISGDPGFQAQRGSSVAIRRNLGFAGLTIASEQGRTWQDIKTSATDQPYRWTGMTLDRRFDDRSWGSIGLSRLDEKRTLLGGRLGSLYGDSGSSSLFIDVEAKRALGSGWTATLSGRRGWTDFAGGRFQSGAYAFDLAKLGVLNTHDRLGLRLSQPLRIEKGGIAMMLPTDYDYATQQETNTLSRLSFTPSGREVDAEISYSTLFGEGWLGANLFMRRQPGHIADADADLGAAIRYSFDF